MHRTWIVRLTAQADGTFMVDGSVTHDLSGAAESFGCGISTNVDHASGVAYLYTGTLTDPAGELTAYIQGTSTLHDDCQGTRTRPIDGDVPLSSAGVHGEYDNGELVAIVWDYTENSTNGTTRFHIANSGRLELVR